MENPQEEEIQSIIDILKNLDLEVGSLQKNITRHRNGRTISSTSINEL